MGDYDSKTCGEQATSAFHQLSNIFYGLFMFFLGQQSKKKPLIFLEAVN